MLWFVNFLYRLIIRVETLNAKTENQTILRNLTLIILTKFLMLYGKFIDSVFYLTRFYPFSIFYRTNIAHYQNRDCQEFANMIRKGADKLKSSFRVLNYDRLNPYLCVIGDIKTYKKGQVQAKKLVLQIEKSNPKLKGQIFGTDEGNRIIKLLVPGFLIDS